MERASQLIRLTTVSARWDGLDLTVKVGGKRQMNRCVLLQVVGISYKVNKESVNSIFISLKNLHLRAEEFEKSQAK